VTEETVAIAKAAQRAIMSSTVRDTGNEWHAAWLADMNALAKVVPATRDFEQDPLN